MLQQVEYNPGKFLIWVKSIPNLSTVKRRGELVLTNRVKLMLVISYIAWLFGFVVAIAFSLYVRSFLPMAMLIFAPLFSIFSLFGSSLLLQKFIVSPAQSRELAAANQKLGGMKAVRIAVLGSYGKTTMKELLLTVLSEGKKVAATPGNKNVLISHARWVDKTVKGDEDVLVFEYGEGESGPGDISRLAAFSQPDIAVITGLAPAHLDVYPSLKSVAEDFASIAKTVEHKNIFVNGISKQLRSYVEGNYYTIAGIADWKVSDIHIDFKATSFTLLSEHKKLHLYTGLLGAHNIGPLCAVVAIARQLGLTEKQIMNGVANTMSYEHRMQSRSLGGAWIIDDTYNGNIEGMRAGLELLKALPGKRKIYVTPGLVDQGSEVQAVHEELGHLIATVNPDRVVLMQNSATAYIRTGLNNGEYLGEVTIETNPLEYYTNLDHFLAAGDVAMLQNDWPDSYK